MSNRNETPTLLVSLFITVMLLGGLGIWGWRLFQPTVNGSGESSNYDSPPSAPEQTSNTAAANQAVTDRLSTGERVLITAASSSLKDMGIDAFAAGDAAQAVTLLEAAIRENRNDPEALIYLNNAQIAGATAYTIAVAAPIETALNPALEILRGVAQAQAEINQAGGINGVPLRIMIADDGNTPETATQVASQLVATDDVLAVIGHFSSGVTLATEPVYTQGELPLISPTSTSVQISGVSDYVFRTAPSDRFTATALARYMLQELDKQRVAIFFNSESDYSASLKDEFTTAVFSDGGQVLAEFDLVDTNFNAEQALSQLEAQDIEVIMLAANTPTLDQALTVVRANDGDLDLLGGDSLYNPQVLDVGGATAADLVVAIPWHLLAHTDAPFVQASRTLWGGDVSWRTATTYDAVKSLAAAIATLSSIGRQPLQRALSATSFTAEGATSEVRFLPSGDRNQAAQLVIVQPGSRSGHGYDFVPVPQANEP